MREGHSLGHLARELAQALQQRGTAVHLSNTFSQRSTERVYTELAARFPHHEPFGDYFVLSYLPFDPRWPAHGHAVPCIWEFSDTFRLGRTLAPSLYNAHRYTFTLSEHSRTFLASRGVKNAVVVPCGVNPAVFHPEVAPLDLGRVFDPAHWSFRAWGSPEPEGRTFLLSGFLQEKKGVSATVRAWEEFWAENPDCTLLIKNTTDYWGKSVIAEIERAHRRSSICYTEQALSDAQFPRLLASVDVVIQPSHLEGFGLIPLQAMAVGKPVAVTDWGGFTEYATNQNAALIPCRPVESWPYRGFPYGTFTPEDGATAFARALDMAHDPRAVEARQSTAARFSWAASAERLSSVLEADAGVPLRRLWPVAKPELVSVVVALKTGSRGLADIERLVQSFRAHETHPYEIVVMDDGSETPVQVEGARVLRVPCNEGTATARNRSLLAATGEYVLLLDADVEITAPVLGKLIARLQGRNDLILHPKLLYPDGTIQSAGAAIELQGDQLRPYHRCEHQRADFPAAQQEAALQYAPTAAHFFRRSLPEKYGLFWEEYRITCWEDVHWCHHLRAQGVEIRYFPEVSLIHHQGSYTRSTEFLPSYFTTNAALFRRYFPHAIEMPVTQSDGRSPAHAI